MAWPWRYQSRVLIVRLQHVGQSGIHRLKIAKHSHSQLRCYCSHLARLHNRHRRQKYLNYKLQIGNYHRVVSLFRSRLLAFRQQAIIWTNAGLFSIEHLLINVTEIWIIIYKLYNNKMNFKCCQKWTFCLTLNVIRIGVLDDWQKIVKTCYWCIMTFYATLCVQHSLRKDSMGLITHMFIN